MEPSYPHNETETGVGDESGVQVLKISDDGRRGTADQHGHRQGGRGADLEKAPLRKQGAQAPFLVG